MWEARMKIGDRHITKNASCPYMLPTTMAATVARRQRPCVALTALLLTTILMMLPCHHQAVEVVAGQPRQPKAGGAVANHTITTQPDRSSTTPPAAHLLLVDPSQTYYLKRGDMFFVASQSALNLHTSLPVGSYTVGRHVGEYYLQEILPFDLTGQKLYGDTQRQAERILHTFRARGGDGGIGNNGPPTSSSSTGVLLAGQKGSGKTLLAKYISVRAAQEMGVSTIVINEPWSGERFNAFIQSIRQPCIVLFDEFEKVYRQSTAAEVAEVERIARYNDGHHNLHHFVDYNNNGELSSSSSAANTISNPSQDAILTLLDGVYPSTMLFLFTVNDKTKLSRNMMNRPGRIYYVLDFAGLEANFIRECTFFFVNSHTRTVHVFVGIVHFLARSSYYSALTCFFFFFCGRLPRPIVQSNLRVRRGSLCLVI
jgi:hypothetical protein